MVECHAIVYVITAPWMCYIVYTSQELSWDSALLGREDSQLFKGPCTAAVVRVRWSSAVNVV